MRTRFLFAFLLAVCLLAFSGCSCEHSWSEADCLNPKICTQCQETQGEPLGHNWSDPTCLTPKTCTRCSLTQGEPLGHSAGEWKDVIDMLACSGTKEQRCTVCDGLLDSQPVTLSSLVRDDLFLFTPREFMERLTALAEPYFDEFTYEFVPGSTGLQVQARSDEKQSIIQFFRTNVSALGADDMDTAAIWCVSLIQLGEAQADFRHCFLMACDPALDMAAASDTDPELSAALADAAAAGEPYGYYQLNQLLYELSDIPEGALGQDTSMHMVNVYASDFR